MFEFSTVQTSDTEWEYISVNTIDEINQAYEDNNIIGIKVDISLALSSSESAIRTDYPKYIAMGDSASFVGTMFGESAFDGLYTLDTSGSYYKLEFLG